VAQKVFPQTKSIFATAGDIFYVVGFLTALILWGFGLIWLFFALTSIFYTKKFPFNIGWWDLPFPLVFSQRVRASWTRATLVLFSRSGISK